MPAVISALCRACSGANRSDGRKTRFSMLKILPFRRSTTGVAVLNWITVLVPGGRDGEPPEPSFAASSGAIAAAVIKGRKLYGPKQNQPQSCHGSGRRRDHVLRSTGIRRQFRKRSGGGQERCGSAGLRRIRAPEECG